MSLMEPVRYYCEEFGAELQRVRAASSDRYDRSISVVSLVPDHPDGSHAERAAAFRQVRSRPLFLFCYFFTALIDQAIHASLRQEHAYFDHLARYPKLVGILAALGTNLHPAVLLLAATLYLHESESEAATEQFKTLADFFIKDYHHFLDVKYPALTGRLTDPGERRDAVRRLFTELSSALALLFVPTSLGSYSRERPNRDLYESWVRYFNRGVNAHLRWLESGQP